MYRVTLLNMPFAALTAPSLALTQLKARIEEQFKGRVRVRVLYLNHDFAHYLGLPSYRYLADSLEANMSGLGDWFFRDSAFPDLPNNTEEYWQRFFPQRDDKFELRRQLLLKKRLGLESLLSRLIAKYELGTDDLIGFTSMFAQNVACFALAKKLKERRPEIVTVMGGANCEAAMGQELVRQINQIDFVFSGPALVSFPQFVGHQLNREEALCHDIRGVFSKQNVRLCPVGGANAIGEELNIDTEVQLDYEPFLAALDQNFPSADVGPTLQFETSRGCWWGERAHCTFCGLNGTTMAYRAMRSEKAIEQFKRLFSYWPRCSRFESVDNIMPKQYLADVFPHLDPPPQSTIFYEVKADLRADELKTLSRAGVKEIQPGIEALATSTLKLMRKGTTAFQNITFLKHCLTYGIQPVWNLLIGFPGETEEVYEKYLADLPSLLHLPPPSGVYPVRFDRFSPYFVHAQQYGLDLHPSDFYGFIYPFSREALANLAYYFSDHNYSAPYMETMITWSDRLKRAVSCWRARWEDDGQPAKPRLVLIQREGAAVVCDTRNKSELEHEVGDTGAHILRYLGERRQLRELENEFSHISSGDLVKTVSRFKEQGLIFEEDERYLSLVLTDETQLLSSDTEHPGRRSRR